MSSSNDILTPPLSIKACLESAKPDVMPVSISGTSQTPSVRLNVDITAYSRQLQGTNPTDTYLVVDLGRTTVAPGNLAWNQNDKRGFYTHEIDVKIWVTRLDETAGAWVDSGQMSEFQLATDAPPTSPQGGSTSVSSSLSVSAGWMGKDPMANASYSVSSAVSQTWPDFAVDNESNVGADDKTSVHLYKLRFADGKYESPDDLVSNTTFPKVIELPDRAMSNYPIASSAIFHSPKLAAGARRVHVRVTHKMMCVEKTFVPLSISVVPHPNVSWDSSIAERHQKLLKGDCVIDITPSFHTYNYSFDVNFDAKTIKEVS